MNDPMEEIFNGTPDGIDEEELREMEALEQSMKQTEVQLQEELQTQDQASTTTPQQQEGSTEQKEEPKKEEGEAKEEKPGNTLTDALAMPMMIPIAAWQDWGTDLVNMIPGVNLPKILNSTLMVYKQHVK